MNLLTKWRELSENLETQEAEIKFWEEYLKVEASIYNEILNNKVEVVEGKVADLAAKYNTSVEYFMGFIDGISESLKEDITLETIEADSTIKLDIDFEKLYYNMVAVEAHWLYNLPGWEAILPADKRKELQKAYKTSKTVVKEEKVGRNDACPCGSGKKYKKCCGKKGKIMFILRFINDDDDLSVKEFVSLTDLKEYINQNNLEKTWHQIEEVKKVIPNLKEN